MKIDNFALTMHQACPTRFKYRMVDGWQLRRRSGALGFGSAFHAGLAEWYKDSSGPIEDRIDRAINTIEEAWDNSVPLDDYRTLNKCVDVFGEYVREYPAETFSVVGAPHKPIVEQTFTIALGTYLPCNLSFINDEPNRDRSCHADQRPTDSVCSCGLHKEPIEYGGIFDGLVHFGNKVYILEHKTTSQLGDYYFTQYKPNNQVTGYIWAAGEMSGMEVAGAIINAIGVYKVGKTKLRRQVTTRDDEEIAEWKASVTYECESIARDQLRSMYPMRTTSCTQYGLCEFHQVCTLSDPKWREKRLEQDYERSHWDYTRRDDNASG